jgi:hypothetical protein
MSTHSMHLMCRSCRWFRQAGCFSSQVFTEHMVTLSLSGYMFFGSALAVSDRVLHVRLLSYAALAAFAQRACLAILSDCLLLPEQQAY